MRRRAQIDSLGLSASGVSLKPSKANKALEFLKLLRRQFPIEAVNSML